ncbi:MAG TPA: LacI family DNA-binding transcriptional regulator, partial [Microbacteriaceae bacterium]|nr:LacI family DNA-binding transcriptional regulator [Microbacteriaceae bacterium]
MKTPNAPGAAGHLERRPAATMADVARRAGVSVTTVSFVVNGTKHVAPKTAARVRTAMQELHYQRNALARALASQRSHILALLFPALDRRLGRTDLTFITAAVTAAAKRGYHLVIWPIGQDAGQLSELLAARLADGVLVMEVTLEDARVALLRQAGVPFTMIGRTRDLTGLSYVDVDFELATSEALDHLRGLGHTRIVLVLEDLAGTPMRDYGPHVRVRSTYEEEMRRHGLSPQILYCAATSDGGRRAAQEILAEAPDTTAVVALGDDVANGILNEFHRLGRR